MKHVDKLRREIENQYPDAKDFLYNLRKGSLNEDQQAQLQAICDEMGMLMEAMPRDQLRDLVVGYIVRHGELPTV